MVDNEDWVMRPVAERMCLYESILDCKIDLEAIARMNAALDVRAENQKRFDRANDS